ncbi:hypothetical protein [Falsiroseomonas sp.]|uniref:hypothetical protein n=1 Tax=Falsiroseomonas sp. TaxID=2870721 RepID=UPI0034A29642
MTMDEIIDADAPVQEGASPLLILRYAVAKPDSGLVLNIIEAAQGFVLDDATLVLDDGTAVIGGTWDGAAFRPPAHVPAPPPPVPTTISFRQLILGLLDSGFLTAEQALAAAETRARPPQLEVIIATLPEDASLAARITWATMSEARRGDPLFAALIAAGHATAEQVDEIFRAASQL